MATTVNIHEAKTHLSRLLEQVAAGEDVTIAKAGVPIADLVPHRADIVFGTLSAALEYDDASFESVDPDITAMFYGSDA